MNIDNPLPKFPIEYWYHVLMVIGATLFILSGSGLLTEFPVGATSIIAAGTFFFGLGEWVNHPLQTALYSGDADFPAGRLTGHPRKGSLIGYVFDLVGIGLIAFGLCELVPAIRACAKLQEFLAGL